MDLFLAMALTAVCISAPVNGPVIESYSPSGQYSGHWGTDFAAAVGDPVKAPATGRVTFAGSVAGTKSVTIQPVAGVKLSTSYLESVGVSRGEWVRRGDVIATAGMERGVPGVHLSLRIGGRYVDPEPHLGCVDTDISRALRLITPPRPYPRSRAHRHSRGDIRSDSHRSPPRRRVSAAPGGARPGGVHTGR